MSLSQTAKDPAPSLRLLNSRQIQWIAAGFFLTFASLPGQTVFIAQFNPSIRATFGLSHGAFGLIYTLATLASSALLIFAGGLTDRFSTRNLAIACLIGLGLTSFFFSQVNHIIFLGLALFGMRFFGQGMMSQIAATAMARWFNRFRGRALALSHLGYPFGDSILPFAAAFSIGIIGWRNVWMGVAVFIVVVLVPVVVLLLRTSPDGAVARARGDLNPDQAPDQKTLGAQWTRRAVLKHKLFYAIIIGLMAPPAITTLFLFHQAHLAEIRGWSPLTVVAFFPLFSVASVIFGLLAGTLIDRFGAWRLLAFILIPEGIACLFIASLSPVWGIPLFFISFGIAHGIMSPVGSAIWAELYGTAHIGAIRALATSSAVFASAIGPGVAGALIDVGFELDAQAYVYASVCFVCAVLFILLRPALARQEQNLSATR